MILEGGPSNEEPGGQLREVGHHDEKGLPAAAPDVVDDEAHNGQQSAPADHRVGEGGKGRLAPRYGGVVQIVEDGPSVHDPLIPAGGVGVGVVDALVVGEHILLIFPHLMNEVAQAGIPFGGGVGPVGEGIDAGGDHHEAQHGKGQCLDQPEIPEYRGSFPLLHFGPVPQLEPQAQEIEQSQSHAAIDDGPFAGRADPPEEAGEEQPGRALPERGARREGEIPVHEVVHGQDEEHPVGVDGGDAGLGEMHEIKGKEGRPAEGHRRLPKEIFEEGIEQRKHEHTEERAHKAPAKGSHTEEADTDAQDELAQRGMGDLIGVDPTDVLIGGAGVVDLIKVGGVIPGGRFRDGVSLVKEGGGLPRLVGAHQISRSVIESQLPQFDGTLGGFGGDAQEADLQRILGRDFKPLEEVGVVLGHGIAGLIALRVGPVVAGDGPLLVLPGPEGGPV